MPPRSKPAALLLLLCAVFLCAGSDKTPTLFVQVRSCTIRSGPSFLATPTGSIAIGEEVLIISTTGQWKNVQPADKRSAGWAHASAFATTKASKKAGKTVSPREAAAASTAFNAKIEAALRQRGISPDYAMIDEIEAITIPHAALALFVNQGELSPLKKRTP